MILSPAQLEQLAKSLSDQIEGRSLAPCLRGETMEEVPVFAESGYAYYFDLVPSRARNDIPGRFRSVTRGDWKLIFSPFQPESSSWQLFNVRDDPQETRNLYRADHPQIESLRASL